MRKCFLYSRVSSDVQISGDGLGRQEDKLKQYLLQNALRLNLSVDDCEILVDSGVSGWKGSNMGDTAALGQLFHRVESGEIDGSVLIVESLDRFSRENPFRVAGYIAKLAEHSIDIIDVEQNLVIGTSNPWSSTIASIIANRAHEESTLKSKRIKAAWNSRRKKAEESGQYMIKNTPFWIDVLDDKYVANADASIVREIFDLYLQGYGSFTIAKKMNEAGKVIRNKRWSTPKICALLRNPRCNGDFISHSLERDYEKGTSNSVEHVIKGLYPKIVTDEEFALVLNRLNDGSKNKRVYNDRKVTILNGLLKCSICGGALTVRSAGAYRYVGCLKTIEKGGCYSKPIRYDALEKIVVNHIRNMDLGQVYESNDSQEVITKERIKTLMSHIEEYKAGITQLRERGKKPSFDMLTELQNSEDELELLKKTLEQLSLSKIDLSEFAVSTELFDITQIALRTRLERTISSLLNKIKVYHTKDLSFSLIEMIYVNDVVKHVLVADKKGDVTGDVVIRRNGENTTYESRSVKIIKDEGGVFSLDCNISEVVLNDYLFLMNIVDFVDSEAKEFLNLHLNAVLAH
ncbi:recombinase family protein [Serratia nevei]|uniref:recombinase family protein n=2 Tax=Serratia TaxID=613 RepID=UPI001A2498F3|nr:recombinase family protein [Serratia marcescens]MDF8317167.1 recombinase family protein [Serratia nevei]MDF8322816.1 recombinase family protein [Serratia nevei]MDF8339725.1 recombinase family protein [Serratia nevei]MDF8342679.1 recombinase family protein [Serratia nevei]MDF8350746.1 recombinase family protein [Serratia nevei]